MCKFEVLVLMLPSFRSVDGNIGPASINTYGSSHSGYSVGICGLVDYLASRKRRAWRRSLADSTVE